MTRSEKTLILCPFIFGKAKLERAGKYRYHNVVKWYLLKIDSEIESEKKNFQKDIVMDFFDRFFGIFSHQIEKHPNSVITYLP